MNSIKAWFRGLPDQWRAALRSAWQSAVGFVVVFALAVMAEAVDILNGGTLEESLADVSSAGKIMLVALISVATGLVSLFMNRPSASGSATYVPPNQPQ